MMAMLPYHYTKLAHILLTASFVMYKDIMVFKDFEDFLATNQALTLVMFFQRLLY